MQIRKHPKSGVWVLDTVDPVTGKRIRMSTGKKAKGEALEVAKARIAELERDAADAKAHGGRVITLADAVNAYVGVLEADRRASAKEVGFVRDKVLGLRGHAGTARFRLDGAMLLHKLDPAMLEALIRARRVEGNGPVTIGHELKLLRAASRHAAGLRYRVPDLAVPGQRNAWRIPKAVVKTRYLSWDEWSAVYAYLDPDKLITVGRGGKPCAPYPLAAPQRAQVQTARDLLVALTMTGGRWSEVAALTWDRVDMVAGTVKLFGTKDNEERSVPFPRQFREVLERRRNEGLQTPYVFPGGSTSRAAPGRPPAPKKAPQGSCRPISRAMEAVGLNRPDIVARYGTATIHSLRHTFASWLLQNGADLSEVKDALGHATLEMTLRYATLVKHRTAAKLGGMLDNMGAQG